MNRRPAGRGGGRTAQIHMFRYFAAVALLFSLAFSAILIFALQVSGGPTLQPATKPDLRSVWASMTPIQTHDSTIAAAPRAIRLYSESAGTAGAPASLSFVPPAPSPIFSHPPTPLTAQSFPSCTHWSHDDAVSFAERTSRVRADPGSAPLAAAHIPRQILLNFGLWSGFALPAAASADGADISADPALAKALPSDLRERVQCWLETHPPPLWRVRLWDGPSSEAFMRRYYGRMLEPGGAWAAYPRRVQRSDLLRVLLVAHFGGLYVDLDVRPPAGRRGDHPHPLDELWAAHPTAAALLFEENILSPADAAAAARAHTIRGGRPEECQRIANYMLAAAPAPDALLEYSQLSPAGAPAPSLPAPAVGSAAALLQRLLRLMVARAAFPVRTDYDVLFTSGPALLTEAVYAHARVAVGSTTADEGGCGLASDLLDKADAASSGGAGGGVVIVRRPDDQRYFDHLTAGTWRASGDSKPLRRLQQGP